MKVGRSAVESEHHSVGMMVAWRAGRTVDPLVDKSVLRWVAMRAADWVE